MLDVWELALIVLINGFIDCVLVAWLAGRRSRQALEKWLESEKSEEALKHILETAWNWMVDNGKIVELWNWVMAGKIETGQVIKTVDEESGQEVSVKETITPFVAVCRGVANYVKMGILGKTGQDKLREKELQQAIAIDLQDPQNPLGAVMRSALPTALLRAQKTGDYSQLVQLGLGMLVQDYLKKRQSSPSQPSQPLFGGGDQGLKF